MTAESPTTAPVAAPESGVEAPAPAEPTGGHAEAKNDAAKELSFKERRARAVAIFKGGAVETPVVETPAEPVVEAAPEPEPAPVVEATAKENARLVKAALDLKERNAENLRLKQELKAANDKYTSERATEQAEFAKMKAQLDAFMKDPRAALKAHGGYDGITKKVLAGELKMPTADEVLAEQMAERMSPIEQKMAELQAKLDAKEAAEAKATEDARSASVRTNDLGLVKTFVEAADDRFPLVAAHPGGHQWVLDLCYQHQTQNIEAQAQALEEHLASQALAYLQSPKALARLRADPKVRETLGATKATGQSGKTVVSSDGPRVLARDVVSAPTTPVERPKTQAERKARAQAILFGKT